MKLQFLHIETKDLPLFRPEIEVSYQLFGVPLEEGAPRILVNHALTGNSLITGERGWWNALVGPNQIIDTNQYSVIAIDVPGNGFDGKKENLVEDYKLYTTAHIASIFWKVLSALGVQELHAIVGGSIGGAIAWEMAFLKPDKVRHLIPIASTYQTSDWLEAHAYVQEQILSTSTQPIQVARQHAMLLYRTPNDLKQKFNSLNSNYLKSKSVVDWLDYHGEALVQRFDLLSYQLMNQLLRTIGKNLDADKIKQFAHDFNGQIHQIAIDSDLFFTAEEQRLQIQILSDLGMKISHQEITSIHGHDAFLIEFEQLNELLKNTF